MTLKTDSPLTLSQNSDGIKKVNLGNTSEIDYFRLLRWLNADFEPIFGSLHRADVSCIAIISEIRLQGDYALKLYRVRISITSAIQPIHTYIHGAITGKKDQYQIRIVHNYFHFYELHFSGCNSSFVF
jgi:hypothetical protein